MGGCAADRAAELRCLSNSLPLLAEDAKEADFAAKIVQPFCAQHKSRGLGKPLEKGVTRTQSQTAIFFIFLLKASSKKTEV